MSDPLEGLESRPLDVQVGVLANEVRNQRNAITDVKDELKAVRRALWGLVLSVLSGLILFFAAIAFNVVGSKGHP